MQPEKWWYLTELANHIGTRPSSLQRELRALVETGILERRREGTRVYFRAQRQSPIFRELRSLLEKTVGIVPILQQTLEAFEPQIVSAFIYGSLARAKEHAGSDIDLMVVGKIGLAELAPGFRDAEKRLQREINVINFSTEEFRDKYGNHDHFLTRVVKDAKYFLKGSQSELEAIARQP